MRVETPAEKYDGGAPVVVHASTHPGLVRPRNEDSVGCSGWAAQGSVTIAKHSYSDRHPILCVVADGLGGQPGGDVASLAVVRHLVHGPPLRDTGELGEALLAAHEELIRRGVADPGLAGMATTVAVLVIAPDAILCANVGDTRIYEATAGSVLPVSFDDSPDAAGGTGSGGSVLTQALGGSRPPKPHVQWFKRESLGFLLCSDGLTNAISDAELAAAFASGETDEALVGSLMDLALERGASDNVTMMLVRT